MDITSFISPATTCPSKTTIPLFQSKSYLLNGGPKVVNEAANVFEGLVWPDSKDVAKKYQELKYKIEAVFVPGYAK